MTTDPGALPRPRGGVLVRVSPEILERMKAGDVEPVVILGVEEQDDGTHDMTLMTTDLIYENRKLRESVSEARDLVAQAYSDDEDNDSPGNMAFAILNHALARAHV